MSDTPNQYAMRDPRTQYPRPPFPRQPQDVIEQFGDEVPYDRPGQPAEIAPTHVFLATQESGYITGEVVGVTGGNPTT